MWQIFELMSLSPTFFYSVIAVLGLMIGSFLNVVIHRLPIAMERQWQREVRDYIDNQASGGEISTAPNEQANGPAQQPYNLLVPRSACPHCHHQLTVWENIPVISWLVQRGRCRACGVNISVRYPLVEIGTALLSLAVALKFGVTLQCAAALLLTWSLICLAVIDADTMLLPDQITLPLVWVGLLLASFEVYVSLHASVYGAVIGYLCLWSLYWIFVLITGKEGMGYGDFKLLAALGAWVGWTNLATIVVISSFTGVVIGIITLKMQHKPKSQPIPFGPYLAIAGWLTLMYGDWITQHYWDYVLA